MNSTGLCSWDGGILSKLSCCHLRLLLDWFVTIYQNVPNHLQGSLKLKRESSISIHTHEYISGCWAAFDLLLSSLDFWFYLALWDKCDVNKMAMPSSKTYILSFIGILGTWLYSIYHNWGWFPIFGKNATKFHAGDAQRHTNSAENNISIFKRIEFGGLLCVLTESITRRPVV